MKAFLPAILLAAAISTFALAADPSPAPGSSCNSYKPCTFRNVTILGDAGIVGNLTVTGYITVDGGLTGSYVNLEAVDLHVIGDAGIDENLVVLKNARVGGDAGIGKNFTVGNSLTVTADAGVGLNLNVGNALTVAAGIVSNVASGADGLTIGAGAKLNLGGGQKLSSDSSGIQETGGYFIAGGVQIGAASGQLNASASNTTAAIKGNATDGASAVGVRFGNLNSLTTDGAHIADFCPDASNPTTSAFSVTKQGSIQLNMTGAGQPACDVDHRGQLYFLKSGSGDNDQLSICARTSSDQYFWIDMLSW